MSEASALSRLSKEALCSAEALSSRDVTSLFEHLYAYNSVPVTRVWERRFPNAAAVGKELGLLPGGELSAMLAELWVSARWEAESGWLTWVKPTRYERLGGSETRFKLYLSPAIEDLPAVVAALVETLSYSHATSFKVGSDAAGLLRPDKLVAYFSDVADLSNAAHELALRLDGVVAQGVPFTSEIYGDGLLSWGIDPPAQVQIPGKIAPSWREWVCYRLALALVDGQQEDGGSEPVWKKAVERLRIEGVQIDRWLPSPAYWDRTPW